MVLLAASICTRGGKPVLSRQFREMPRSRVEALLSSFPKLISASSGAQHTSVETDSVRYVYQPLEDLYMILITNKSSNILQDIDTLHLFARVVADMCRSLDERTILRSSFELLGAFDEIVSLGYRENVNLSQIRSILEMESHEEKIQEIIERNKELEAKEELKRRAKQLEMQRREATRRGQMGGGYGGGMGGSGGFGAGGAGGFQAPVSTAPVVRDTGAPKPAAPAAVPFKSKGMQLGKKSKNADLLGAMGEPAAPIAPASAAAATSRASASAAAPTAAAATASRQDPLALLPPVAQEAVHLVTKERLTVTASRDGSLQHVEVKGDLELRISDPSLTKLRIALSPSSPASSLIPESAIVYKTHPHVDKEAWGSSRTIAIRPGGRPFPVNQNLGVLRWRAQTKDEAAVPITLNVWTTPGEAGAADVTLELETVGLSKSLELSNVTVTVPLPEGVLPSSLSSDLGEPTTLEDGGAGAPVIVWDLGELGSSSTSASLEFSVDAGAEDVDVFFPARIDFVAPQSISGVSVADVQLEGGPGSIGFSAQEVISADNYTVV